MWTALQSILRIEHLNVATVPKTLSNFQVNKLLTVNSELTNGGRRIRRDDFVCECGKDVDRSKILGFI